MMDFGNPALATDQWHADQADGQQDAQEFYSWLVALGFQGVIRDLEDAEFDKL